MGNFQMTDAKTWGNVVGNKLVIFFVENIFHFIHGEIPYQNGLFMGNFQMISAKTWGISMGNIKYQRF